MPDVAPKPGALARLRSALRAGIQGFKDTYGSGGFLSPGQPVAPRLPEGSDPRQWAYQPGINIYQPPRADLATPFDILRQLAEVSDLVRIAIAYRKAQLIGMKWDVAAIDPDQSEKRRAEIETVKAFFQKPDRTHTWGEWMDVLLEDLFVIDALTLYRRRTRKGTLYALEPVDGASVKPLIDYWGRTPEPPLPAYQQYLYGRPDSQFTTRELLYKPKNRRINTTYGFSPVEWVLIKINMSLRRDTFTLSHFTDGTVPEGFLTMPEDWTATQIREFQEHFDLMMAGRDPKRARITMIPATKSTNPYVQTKQWEFDREFDEWLARIVAAAFQLPGHVFEKEQTRATAEVGRDDQSDIGLRPLQLYFKMIFDQVIWEDLGFTDLHWAWVADKSAHTKDQVDKYTRYVERGIMSIDEIRINEGAKPLGIPNGIITKTGFVPLELAIQQAEHATAGMKKELEEMSEEDEDAEATAGIRGR